MLLRLTPGRSLPHGIFEFDGTYFWVGGAGPSVAGTRKFRNINAGNTLVALVIDDLISLSPFIARAMRVYGYAERPVERVGMVGPGLYSSITPTISWSWNLASEPAGAASLARAGLEVCADILLQLDLL